MVLWAKWNQQIKVILRPRESQSNPTANLAEISALAKGWWNFQWTEGILLVLSGFFKKGWLQKEMAIGPNI